MISRREALLLGLSALLVVVGVSLFSLPFVTQALSARPDAPAPAPAAPTGAAPASATAAAQTKVHATRAEPTPPGVIATGSAAAAAATIPTATSSAGPSLDAYEGLGSWVDIYDTRAWKNPGAAVGNMAKHGVRTLYIETANSNSRSAIDDAPAMQTFIREAHARGMLVVAWYLPNMTSTLKDYSRIAQAIGFRTSDGQRFDSFALDIESSAVGSESARNRALRGLSKRIRALVGPTYALGAIIPSPTGLAKKRGYWNAFPYASIAQTYDVFVPMSYYTYHGKGASVAYADTLSNVRILRAQPGCAHLPIHLIGGIAENSSAAEVDAFVRGATQTGCIGASLYSWPGTTAGDWRALSAIKP